MNPIAPTTYTALLAVLTKKETSQRDLARELGVSLGQTNKVFQWLEQNRFVERTAATGRATGKAKRDVYVLTNPTGLLRAVSLFRDMNRLMLFTMAVDTSREDLLSDLREHSVIFCLGTALERFSKFYRSDEVSFYAVGGTGRGRADELRESLAARREGITRLACYSLDTRTHGRREREDVRPREAIDRLTSCGFAEKTPRGVFTTKVQTVVDLFCDGKAFAARDLLKELWGINL